MLANNNWLSVNQLIGAPLTYNPAFPTHGLFCSIECLKKRVDEVLAFMAQLAEPFERERRPDVNRRIPPDDKKSFYAIRSNETGGYTVYDPFGNRIDSWELVNFLNANCSEYTFARQESQEDQ